jgi:hypothetical protein
MSAADAKKALDACQKGIDKMEKINTDNIKTIDENTANNTAYQTKKTIWETGKADFAKEQLSWNSRKDAIVNELKKEERTWNNCAWWDYDASHPNKHDDWCVNDIAQGWYHSGGTGGGCPGGQGKGVCKKTDALMDKEATAKLNDTWIPGPGLDDRMDNGVLVHRLSNSGNYPIAQPVAPIDKQLNTTNLSISCCSNSLSILASDVTGSNITQQNDCLSQKKADVKSAEELEKNKAKEVLSASAKESTSTKTLTKTDKTSSDKIDTTSSDDKAATQKKNIISIAIVFFAFCCMSIVSIALILLIN